MVFLTLGLLCEPSELTSISDDAPAQTPAEEVPPPQLESVAELHGPELLARDEGVDVCACRLCQF